MLPLVLKGRLSVMKIYDLYLFGPLTDLIVGWHKFKSGDHESAIAVAVSMKLVGRQELWCEGLLVESWPQFN